MGTRALSDIYASNISYTMGTRALPILLLSGTPGLNNVNGYLAYLPWLDMSHVKWMLQDEEEQWKVVCVCIVCVLYVLQYHLHLTKSPLSSLHLTLAVSSSTEYVRVAVLLLTITVPLISLTSQTAVIINVQQNSNNLYFSTISVEIYT